MPAGDATLPLIYAAMAEWEQAELVNADVERAGFLTAYAYFPTQADVKAGLTYPYTVHGCDTTAYQRVTASNTPSVTMWNTHTFWTGLIFGQNDDPFAALYERDARWREAYMEGFVKHLQLATAGVALVAQLTLISAVPFSFDLFGRPEVGVKFSIQAEVRRNVATAL